MAKYYEKINWKDGANGGTPLSAENLNKMDKGISDAEMRAGSLEYNEETKGLATESNIAGAKGYKITAITTDTLTLDLGETINLEYAIGEKIYIRNGSTHSLGEIEEINSNEIKYKLWVSLIFKSEVTINESYVYSLDNPNIGEIVIGTDAFALGKESKALGENSFAIGENSIAAGFHSIAFGKETLASFCSFALGKGARAIGDNSVAIGETSQAIGRNSVAIGKQTKAIGEGSFSNAYISKEGEYGSIGKYSHTEGANTLAKGDQSHAEGSGTNANANNSHAEGYDAVANGAGSHAEGRLTRANGIYSHAEGQNNQANGSYSHVGGQDTLVNGSSGFAHGFKLTSQGNYQTVFGQYNDVDNTLAFIIGNGDFEKRRPSNALTVDWNGNLRIAGQLQDMNGNEYVPLVHFKINDTVYTCKKGTKWQDLKETLLKELNIVIKEDNYLWSPTNDTAMFLFNDAFSTSNMVQAFHYIMDYRDNNNYTISL